MGFDKVITGGRIVTPEGIIEGDLAIEGEKIVAIGPGLADMASEIIDAEGHLVLPGAIDVHTHLELPFCGTVSSDDWITGSRAAARGGVTSLIDFAIPFGDQTLSEALDSWHAKARGKSLIDYGFHMVMTNETHVTQMETMFERGVPSFKEFMIYEAQGWQAHDGTLFRTLERLKDMGGMLMVHAESAKVLDELIGRYHTPEAMKQYGARLHTMTRPDFTESEAVQRAVKWSEVTGGSLYIVHMSAGESAEVVRQAQEKGVPVLAETCPQYLALDDEVFSREDGHLFGTCPQIKSKGNDDRLWQGLADGELAVVATDTCSFTREQKAMWEGDFTKIPMGMPGLETMLPILYTLGVQKGRMDIETMTAKLSTNPAKIMGLYPKKGSIEVGSDADIVIIHPDKTHEVIPDEMETNTDWSPFEGWHLAGFARTTLSRGEVIVDKYKVCGEMGRGQWLPRDKAGFVKGLR